MEAAAAGGPTAAHPGRVTVGGGRSGTKPKPDDLARGWHAVTGDRVAMAEHVAATRRSQGEPARGLDGANRSIGRYGGVTPVLPGAETALARHEVGTGNAKLWQW